MITIHIPGDAPRAAVDAALARLLAAQPWEIPVIEVAEVALAARK